jgi:prevent-host-death family protein
MTTGRKKVAEIGAESARQQLPALLERASRGETTIITKHGRRCAALVPLEAANESPSPIPFTSLRGSGKGLWGNVTKHVDLLRKEWR